MKEYFIKLVNTHTKEEITVRKMLDEKTIATATERLGQTDSKGFQLTEFWEIK